MSDLPFGCAFDQRSPYINVNINVNKGTAYHHLTMLTKPSGSVRSPYGVQDGLRHCFALVGQQFQTNDAAAHHPNG